MQRTWTNVIKKHILPLCIFAVIIAADQITKIAASNGKVNIVIIKGLLSFTYTENRGAALSFLAGKSWAQTFFLVVTAISLPVFAFMYFRADKNYTILRCSLVLILAGAVGNFIDRIANGFVVDFISLHFFPAIFNVADIGLTFGAIMFVWHYLFQDKDAIFKKKPKTQNQNEDL